MKSLIIVMAVALLLSACGWQLRSAPQYLALESVSLDGGSHDLRRRVSMALEDSGVLVHNDSLRRLQISDETWDRRTVAVDAQGRAAEIELRYGFNWQLREFNGAGANGSASSSRSSRSATGSSEGATLTPRRRINLIRNFNFDAANATAASDEERFTRQDMFEDATLQLLRQLDAASRQLIEDEALDADIPVERYDGAPPRPSRSGPAGSLR
ncbi:MAG: hypothetical protein LAT61_13610 [Alcanivorax sp.]|nr:hypothetical protein [Alcanivorax sp.]